MSKLQSSIATNRPFQIMQHQPLLSCFGKKTELLHRTKLAFVCIGWVPRKTLAYLNVCLPILFRRVRNAERLLTTQPAFPRWTGNKGCERPAAFPLRRIRGAVTTARTAVRVGKRRDPACWRTDFVVGWSRKAESLSTGNRVCRSQLLQIASFCIGPPLSLLGRDIYRSFVYLRRCAVREYRIL